MANCVKSANYITKFECGKVSEISSLNFPFLPLVRTEGNDVNTSCVVEATMTKSSCVEVTTMTKCSCVKGVNANKSLHSCVSGGN
jgi:hypothetical protein